MKIYWSLWRNDYVFQIGCDAYALSDGLGNWYTQSYQVDLELLAEIEENI